jgi:uncharacterized RDD family membrane protein YckC
MAVQGSFSPSEVAAEIELRPAKFADRFIAYVIDVLPFSAGYAVTVWAAASGRWPELRVSRLQVALAWILACLLYQAVGNLAGGQIGKRLMGLRVVSVDGEAPGLFACLARALGYALSTPLCSAGFVLALLHPENRALDDLLSGTIVVESQPKADAESSLLFICAVIVLGGLYAGGIYLNLNAPTASDLAALAQARQGLFVLAAVEENCKARNGAYTQSLPDLAQASGNTDTFQSAMLALFMPDGVQMTAGTTGYRLSAKARDRRQTRLTLEGPPPRVR